MTSIAIQQFKARYHARQDDVARLRRITDATLANALERAVDRAGIGADAYLCVRDLHTTVRLSLDETDATLAESFGAALADAISNAAAGASPSILYYSSRAQALADVASRAMAGQFGRQWAWKQLGLWSTDAQVSQAAAAELVLRAIAGEPRLAAAVIEWLANKHPLALTALVARATPRAWVRAAREALRAAGAPIDALEEDDAPTDGHEVAASPPIAGTARARAILARSATAQLAGGCARDRHPAVVRALATFAILGSEPSALQAPVEHARSLIAAALQTLRIDADHAPPPRPRDETEADSRSGNVESNLPAAQRIAKRGADADEPLPDVRADVATGHGGLLYLLNVATRIGLAAAMRDDVRLTARGLRWSLHALGMALAGVDATDPAALAFAGLMPDAPPPSSLDDPATSEEAAAIADCRQSIVSALRASLDREDDTGDALLTFICQRPARIAAEPGWIEVRMSLDDVSPDIRRAGVDIDPDWIPWLGVVVRFVYA